PWWITANSDAHMIYGDTSTRGPGSDFTNNGFFNDPVHGGPANLNNGDFWPGFYSRTNVGCFRDTYAAVMDGLRAGRVWVDHGQLISALNVQLHSDPLGFPIPAPGTPLGGTLRVPRGAPVRLSIDIDLANGPNWAQFQPTLARVDVIAGDITGPVTDRDTFTAPNTKVVKSFDVGRNNGSVSFNYAFTADRSFYVRIRGTDGNRSAPGLLGAAVDPAGPAMDGLGDAGPGEDPGFYSHPIFVLVR